MVQYHETTMEGPERVQEYQKKAIQQDEAVLGILKLYYPASLSPTEVWEIYTATGRQAPITSIRRALSNLTREGMATKTDIMKEGQYGRKEHTWKLMVNHGPARQLNLF